MTDSPSPSPRRGIFRRHKVLTGLLVTALLLGLAGGGWLFYLRSQLEDVARFDAGLDRPDRPDPVAGESVTILVAGVDVNEAGGDSDDLRAMLESGDWVPGSYRSDAIMVLHIDGEDDTGELVSIPRDSYVPVEGLGRTKINAAMSAGGPALLASTVEDVTQMRLDHVVVVDFEGFKEITELLGGVEVYVPETVTDTKNDKTWTEGRHVIEGEEALLYVRQRFGLEDGDFDRVQRQQNFLRALLAKATSRGVLSNPFTVTAFVRDLSELIIVDDSLDADRMQALAIANRDLRSDDLRFLTVPHDGAATIDGASVVEIDIPATREMFDAIADDTLDAWLEENDAAVLPGERSVS